MSILYENKNNRLQRWIDIVFEKILKLKNKIFTRKQLLHLRNSNSASKNPHQCISNALYTLCKLRRIIRISRGVYRLINKASLPPPKSSHGEDITYRYLKENVKTPKRECLIEVIGDNGSVHRLRADFLISPKNGKNPVIIVEVHGRQHYEKVAYFGDAPAFMYRQYLDRLKMEECERRGYKFIVIDARNMHTITAQLQEKI
jgi:hypothetical protein